MENKWVNMLKEDMQMSIENVTLHNIELSKDLINMQWKLMDSLEELYRFKKENNLITKEVSNQNSEWDLFHVLGSSANLEKLKGKVSVPTNCLYYQVQLGFVIEDVLSRWLTHQEISNGVIETIQKRKQIHIIGAIEPWEKRPF